MKKQVVKPQAEWRTVETHQRLTNGGCFATINERVFPPVKFKIQNKLGEGCKINLIVSDLIYQMLLGLICKTVI